MTHTCAGLTASCDLLLALFEKGCSCNGRRSQSCINCVGGDPHHAHRKMSHDAGVQLGQLPASAGPAAVGEAVVSNDATGEVTHYRVEGRGPLLIRGLPDGVGRCPNAVVPYSAGADRAVIAANGAEVRARTFTAAEQRESNGERLHGSPTGAARQGIVGDMMTGKRPAPPSIVRNNACRSQDGDESSQRPKTPVREKLSRKSRVRACLW